jgi:putative transposase
MNKIDAIYTKYPFFGARQIKRQMERWYDLTISRKLAGKLMKVMGIEAIYSKPNTSKPHPDHQVFPYLLRHITASYPNHIWGTDITYIKINGSWAYLVAILDWYSRYVINWLLSDNLESDFCVENRQTGLAVAQPDYHNSDQGSQFTAKDYITTLRQYPDIQISMDGRGRRMDNIFTERLWRSVKYHEVYLHDYSSFADARQSLGCYFHNHNTDIPHQSLQGNVPADVYLEKIKLTNC